ncbi:hypothetical protein DL98DRAFT_538140 [Cadophora sp. DSE1049]|nr:hypothetical protein DL98DRAFT_538140 [Cadophora sp. DSE1049]
MADDTKPSPQLQPIRRGARTFTGTSSGHSSWPAPVNGDSWPGHALKHGATMPPLGRINSSGTTTSQQFVKVESSPEFSQNGVSRFRSMLSQFGLSKVPGLGSLTMNFPTIGLPPLVYPAFGLDIEVKSKHKKDAFGRKKWKQMRAVLDTGCSAGNWVSLDTLDDLGIKEYNKLPLNEVETLGAQTVQGVTLIPAGVVNLRWRGVPGPNSRGNCSRDFKMRFMVLDVQSAPFKIMIGDESLWKYGILQAPIFMAKGRRDIVVLPTQKEPTGASKPPHGERKAANEKMKAEKLKKKEEDQKLEEAEKDKEKDNIKDNAQRNTTKSKQGQNGPTLARTDSHHSLESAKSKGKDVIQRVQSLTGDSTKAIKGAT